MAHTSTRTGLTSRAARASLAALLLAGGVGAAQGATAHAAAPRVQPHLAASPKPDFRVDLGNSGAETVSGPATTPTQVFNTNPGGGIGVTQGIELDGAGNVLFTLNSGFVYSYNPNGTQNFVVNTGQAFGSNTNGPASDPVASADGNVYVSADNGNIYKINAATGATNGPSGRFIAYGKPVQQTLKLDDSTGKLFFGSLNGFINSYTTAGTTGTRVYRTAGTSSTQDETIPGCGGTVTSSPSFFGEGALDSSDNFYVASLDTSTNTNNASGNCSITNFGSLYKVSATGAIVGTPQPLAGPSVSAVALVPNAAVTGGSELVVDTRLGYVEAFDTSLNRLFVTNVSSGGFTSSPLVDVARNRVYVSDNAASLFALNLTTGALDTTFGTGGKVGLTGGSQVSPVLDAGGNIYEVDSTGTLFKFSPTGATLYSFNTNIGTGFFSPAIATDGTIYAGGNQGQASGFNTASVATPTVGASTSTPAVGTGTATGAATMTGAATTTTSTSTPAPSPSATTTTLATTTSGSVTATRTGAGSATATRTGAGSATATTIGNASATATTVGNATVTSTPTSTPTSTATSATGTPATGTPTVFPGLAPFWSKFRSDPHNDGVANLKLDLSQPPGILFTDELSPNGGVVGALNSAPAIGPSPDGNAATYRIYQIDDAGRLNAVRPDGSVAWTSTAVLGTYQEAGTQSPGSALSFQNYVPGSPAIAADNSIYAVSDAKYPGRDSGIWRFDPQTGTPTKFFAHGTYLGGSPLIGPDGAVYAGDKDGNVYAVNKDGSQRYTYAMSRGGDCPAGAKTLIQSAPALDKAGNLYVGYGCGGGSGVLVFTGGVFALSPTGGELWRYSYTPQDKRTIPGSEVVNAVVLSPDEQTLYASGYLNPFFALNTGSGALKWTFAPITSSGLPGSGPNQGSIALSPDGSLVYASVQPNSAQGLFDLYALHSSDGTIAGTASYPNTSGRSPAVDANGNVLVALDNGEVLAYGPDLSTRFFDYLAAAGFGSYFGSYLEGPVIGPDGAIFLTDNTGYLHALKQGLILPPPLPPTGTPAPTFTNVPPPTFTAVPPVPTDVPLCPGVPTSTNTATPLATATNTNTATPAAYTPTSTSTGTPGPTGTACPSVPAGTPGAGTPGAGTPTPGVGTPGHGGTPGPGTRTPTATATPVKTPVPVVITVIGLKRLNVYPGYLTVGNLIRVHAETTPTARITYTFRVSYDYPPTKGQHATKGRRTIAIRPILRRASAPRLGVIQPAVALLPDRAAVAAKATSTPTPRSAGKGKPTPTPTPRPGGKGGPFGRPSGKPVTTCTIVDTIRDRGTFHFTRTADRHGLDDYCLRIGAVPSRAIDLRIVLTVQVRSGSKTFPVSHPTTIIVKRRPSTPPNFRLVLPNAPKTIDASVRHNVLYTDQTQTVSSFTARYTHVTYRVAYPGSLTRSINVVADRNGNNTISFRVSYLPGPSVRARATISVLTTQRIGRTTRHARTDVLTFFVRRAPAAIQRRTILPSTISASLFYHVLYTDQTETISSFTARHARVIYSIRYPNGVSRTITVEADRNGNNTTRFRVSYLPAPLVRARATITVLATQRDGRTTRRARPYTLTLFVRRSPNLVRSRAILPSRIDALVRHNVLYTGQTQTVSSFTARHARITYSIRYSSGPTRTISVEADLNGNNTTSFRVTYLPRPSVRAHATITVTATQQAGRTTRRARPSVLTFYVRRDPHRR